MQTYIKILLLSTLLILPSHQNVPEEGGVNMDTWKSTDGIEVDGYYPIGEGDRESLLRDLRSLRARYFGKPRSSFPYYKGLGRK